MKLGWEAMGSGVMYEGSPYKQHGGLTKRASQIKPSSPCRILPLLHRSKLSLPNPHHCLWQDYPLLCPSGYSEASTDHSIYGSLHRRRRY